MTSTFGGLVKIIEEMKNSLKETEKEVNTTEVKEVKELLHKYDVILKDDIDENDLILKYETFYDQLNEYVINKRKEFVDVSEMINDLSGFTPDDHFKTVINKKKNNIDQIVYCINRIVERIRKLEITIFNKRMKELDNMKVNECVVVVEKMEQTQEPLSDELINVIGDQIYDYVEELGRYNEDLIARITGVILESFDVKKLEDKLKNPDQELIPIIDEIGDTLTNMAQNEY